MIKLTDKFTRGNWVEGDILYATTLSSIKSLESLEDNIDDKLLTYLGEDNTGTSTTSASETEIGEVTVTANTARNRVIIFASVSVSGNTNAVTGTITSAIIRIRTGTSATAANNTERESITTTTSHNVTGGGVSSGSSGVNRSNMIIATITSSDETFTSNFFVHVTSIITNIGDATSTVTCNRILVLGI